MVAMKAYPRRIEGPALDWGMSLLGIFWVGGLFLDGWAHTHGRVDESFFTPWHAALYSGFGLNFLALAGVAALNRSRGASWPEVLPGAYWLSLLGVGLWFAGGPGDLAWHTVFGIEEDIDALFSPTHLLLASGLVLAVSGPFRAAWARAGRVGLPALLSLAAAFSTLTFFVQFAHPLNNPWGLGRNFQPEIYQATGVLSWLVFAALFAGVFLLALRRWRLPPGAFTLLLGLNGFAMGFLGGGYPASLVILFALVGLLLDGLYALLRPTPGRVVALRLFAFVAPALICLAFFVAGGLQAGFAWSVHLTGGVVFLCGIVGLLLSLLVVPPAVPAEAD